MIGAEQMTIGKLITSIIKMLEEDEININDEVRVDIKKNENIISGNAHELLVEITLKNERKLTIRS